MPTKKAPKKPAARRKAKPKPVPTIQLRTSERSTFKRCRWQWDRNYNDRLKPIKEAPALRFGTLIHKALELRYPKGIRRGPKPAETFEKLFYEDLKYEQEQWGTFADEEWTDALELGVNMMENFIEEYGRDEDWKVIESEMTFTVPVLDPETGKPLFNYVGTMDGVWQNRMDGGIRIQDWKTTANDPTKVAHLILDDQASAYWTWGVDWLISQKILKPKQQALLDGMLYTYMRKGKRDERPRNAEGHCLNKDGTVSKKQPAPLFHRELVYRSEHEREEARRRVIAEFKEMQMVRSGELDAYKTPGSGPMSHCNFCPYRDLCELHEMGSDWEGLSKATMTTWDPYADHEVAEEGKAS